MKTYTTAMRKLSRQVAYAIGLMSVNSLAHANLNNTFTPYVGAITAYNSNLFLLQNDQAALATLGTTDMSETYQAYRAGINMNWQLGRQLISGHAEVNRTNFNTYSTLDYSGHDLALKWNWLIGDTLSGDTGASETVYLAPFLYTKKPLSNLITLRKAFFNSNIKLNNRWQLKLGAEKIQSTNSDVTQQNNGSNIDTYKTGFHYLTPKGSQIDFNSTVSNASYPNQPTQVNSYTQYDNGVDFDWIATGKTRILGNINYTTRDYNYAPQQNYSGVTGRVSADWFVTGKTTLNLAIYRTIGSYITNTSTYDVTQGASVNATWLATSNIAINLSARHDSIDYLNTPHRLDELSTLGLGVNYTILRNTKLDILAERGIRSSNIDGNSYRYNSLTLGLNHVF